jgi:hypothetical protein
MATKPIQTQQDTIADGKHVAAATRRSWADFKRANSGRKLPLLAETELKELERNLVAAEKAVGGQATQRTGKKASTAAEVEARGKLHGLLVDLRDNVKLTFRGKPELARAFGFGQRISKQQTPSLLSAAGLALESYEKATLRKQVAEAGVSTATMKQIAKARDALASADTAQRDEQAIGKGKTTSAAALLGDVRKSVVHIRKVVGLIYRGQPEKRREFESTLPRRVPKKRPPKTPAGSATPK